MFVLRSKHRDLQARHDHALEQLAITRAELSDWKGSALRTADRNTALTDRLETARRLRTRLARALRACARYRARVRQLERQTDHLQRRLDDAVGLAVKGIEDSGRWQPGSRPAKPGVAS